jgi:hypothetical protein
VSLTMLPNTLRIARNIRCSLDKFSVFMTALCDVGNLNLLLLSSINDTCTLENTLITILTCKLFYNGIMLPDYIYK